MQRVIYYFSVVGTPAILVYLRVLCLCPLCSLCRPFSTYAHLISTVVLLLIHSNIFLMKVIIVQTNVLVVKTYEVEKINMF